MTKYLKYEPKKKTKPKPKQNKSKKTLAQQISLTEGNTLGMNKTAMIDR
jgi:hypothetical protein